MRLKFLFVVGIGIGYVLGARAGRPRYDKLKAKATEAWEDPRVQKVVADTQEFVKENTPVVQEKVVAGTKAAVAGAQDAAARAAETAKDVSEKVAKVARHASENVAKTAKEVRDRIVDRGEEVVDGVIIAAGKARDRALESESDDEGDGKK